VIAAAVATAGSVLLWMNAPFTGVLGSNPAFDQGTGDATRYLMPGVAAGALALALATRRRGPAALLPAAALVGGLVLCAKDTFDLGFPSAPSLATPLTGAAIGAALLAAAGAFIAPRRLPLRGVAWGAGAAVALGALAAPLASGYLGRHADTRLFDSALVRWFDSRRAFTGGDQLVAVSSSVIAPLTGDRLRHPLELIRPDQPCAAVVALPGRAWTVFQLPQFRGAPAGSERCLAGRPPAYQDSRYRVYAPPGG
jgi:hypothetical protein